MINHPAVTHATIENWEYMEIIRQSADPKCIGHLESAIKTIDSVFTNGNGPIHRRLKRAVKKLFGVEELQHDEDFASLIEVCWSPTMPGTAKQGARSPR